MVILNKLLVPVAGLVTRNPDFNFLPRPKVRGPSPLAVAGHRRMRSEWISWRSTTKSALATIVFLVRLPPPGIWECGYRIPACGRIRLCYFPVDQAARGGESEPPALHAIRPNDKERALAEPQVGPHIREPIRSPAGRTSSTRFSSAAASARSATSRIPGIARLISLCQEDNEITDVVLTSEAEGAGLALGATLGGQRAALLMQSSGVGNCINTFSLLRNCGIPCVVVVTMRGEFADFNPWQVPMGSITEPTLKLCGFLTYRIEREEDIEDVVAAGCKMAFGGNLQVAILLSQRMVERDKRATIDDGPSSIRRRLLADRGDMMVVTGHRLGDL